MSKTIEQLRQQAAQIEEATRQGENTQLRVGGLFMDVIDFIGQIPINETVLGPLLQALNNSRLIDPTDGQALVFSVLKDGWTFTDAFTQLKIGLNQISSTVASNYEAFVRVKDQLEAEVAATDQRVREYKTDYDNSQIEYATWKSQTDTSISQYAVAIDKASGDIISISGRVDTAYDQLDFVTNNLDAADKALEKLFNLTGLDYEDPEEAYTASWLYKNRQGIYGAAATFDANGNILQDSKLQVTVHGIEMTAENALGQVSTISQTVGDISLRVSELNGKYSDLKLDVNSVSATVNDPTRGIGALNVKADSVTSRVGTLDGKVAELGVKAVKKDENNYITEAYMNADLINFKFTERWSVRNSNDVEVMWLEPNGNLHITGVIEELSCGSGRGKIYIEDTTNGARIVGTDNNNDVLSLGFTNWNNEYVPRLNLSTPVTGSFQDSSFWAMTCSDVVQINLQSAANTGSYHIIGLESSARYRYCTIYSNAWPKKSDSAAMSHLSVGDVYVDGDTLKVYRYS